MNTTFSRFKQWMFSLRGPATIPLNDQDPVSRWEKIALIVNILSSSLNVARWSAGEAVINRTIGAGVMDWIVITFAVLAGLSLDLAVVATMLSKRAGRRGIWGNLTAISATLFASLIALDMYGGVKVGAYLHVANAVTVYFLLQHLSQPKRAPRALFVAKDEYEALESVQQADQATIQRLQSGMAALTNQIKDRDQQLTTMADQIAALQTRTPTDQEVAERLATGEWPLARIAHVLTDLLGNQSGAAKALNTLPQNVSNWTKVIDEVR